MNKSAMINHPIHAVLSNPANPHERKWHAKPIVYSLLGVAWFSLLLLIYTEIQHTNQQALDKLIDTQETAWQAVQKIHHHGIQTRFETIIATPGVIENLQQALDPKQRDAARKQLYQTLTPIYQKLKPLGIRVFHFHTPDNHSLLRFHQPQKFGDDLAPYRSSVVQANKTLQPIHGFETGRVVSGFRHVFPIVYQGQHLGSVELSQEFEPLRLEMEQLEVDKTYSLIQKSKAIEAKNFNAMAEYFSPSSYSDQWLIQSSQTEAKTSKSIEPAIQQAIAQLAKKDDHLEALLNRGESFARMYLYQTDFYILTFTIIHDIEQQHPAYLVSTTLAPEITANYLQFGIYVLISTLLIGLLGIAFRHIIHANQNQHNILDYLHSINEAIEEGLYVTNTQGAITQINRAALKILSYTEDELLHQNAHQMFHLPAIETYQRCPLEQAILDKKPYEGSLHFIDGSGNVLDVHVSSQLLYLRNELSGSVVVFHDITQQKRNENDLKIAATAFETQDGILITDAKGMIVRVNQSFSRLTGYDAQEVIGHSPAILNSGKQDVAFYQAMWHKLVNEHFWQGEIWNRRKDGSLYIEWLTITAVLNEEEATTHYVANFSDITERYQTQEKIKQLAFYDPLTQLPNRRLLWDRLELALQKAKRTSQYGLLFFIDLDKFKTLNDSKGHQIGDMLLIEVAKRLKNCVRETDTVARIGGDEFVILIEGVERDLHEASQHATQIAQKILAQFHQDFMLNGHRHHSSPSIGIEVFSADSLNAEEVLIHADVAMYEAKQNGRNTLRFFSTKMQTQIDYAVMMQTDLRDALEREEFELYYQSQVNEHSAILSCEALIRWNHPSKGFIQPIEFIPQAEENGLIIPLGEWVIEQACRQLSIWQTQVALAHIQIAVNVSAKQFVHEQFVSHILKTVEQSGVNPKRLKIELTESLVIENLENTIAIMHTLRNIGIEFSMDDFGTGYSSLSVIQQLPLSQIKIDRSFVNALSQNTSHGDSSIIKTIIGMANTLNVEVIAEGVETIEQKQRLRAMGCTLYQGYLFSKPLNTEAFENLIDTLDGFL